jgi:hypothetical protein
LDHLELQLAYLEENAAQAETAAQMAEADKPDEIAGGDCPACS